MWKSWDHEYDDPRMDCSYGTRTVEVPSWVADGTMEATFPMLPRLVEMERWLLGTMPRPKDFSVAVWIEELSNKKVYVFVEIIGDGIGKGGLPLSMFCSSLKEALIKYTGPIKKGKS
jgi:hypothetical protein